MNKVEEAAIVIGKVLAAICGVLLFVAFCIRLALGR